MEGKRAQGVGELIGRCEGTGNREAVLARRDKSGDIG